jgi:hypothetical protein
MKSLNFRGITLAFLTLLLLSCKIHPPTTVDYDTEYDYSKLKTFSWVAAKDNKDDKKVKSLNDKRQIAAIETDLFSKGFSKASDINSADVLLRTHTLTDKKIDVDVFYNIWGYYPYHFHRPFGWPNRGATTVSREYEIGTLVLDIIDPVKKEVIWRGSLSRKLGVYLNRTPEERNIIAKKNAGYLLESFPPNK